MVMNDAASILIIILGVFLALFLVLAIVLIVLLIKVTKRINSITGSVENTTKQFESVATNVGKVTSPALVAKFVVSQLKKASKSKKK